MTRIASLSRMLRTLTCVLTLSTLSLAACGELSVTIVDPPPGTTPFPPPALPCEQISKVETILSKRVIKWSPDGSRVYFNHGTPFARLLSVSADGGEIRLVAWTGAIEGSRPSNAYLGSFDVGPGSAGFVYAACFDDYRGPDDIGDEFLAHHHGFELVVLGPDESSSRRVTTDRHFDSYPVWSPDGSWIAFLSSRDTLPPKDAETPPYLRLEAIRSFGSSRRLVDTGPLDGLSAGRNLRKRGGVAHVPPRWSPDGKRLAFVVIEGNVSPEGDGTYAIVVAGVFDEERHRLTRTVSAPAWSPDGTRVAFARAGQVGIGLYTVRPDGTDVRILTRIHRWEAARSDGHLARVWVPNLAWSPDGERLLFTWDDRVHVVSLDGSTRSWRLAGPGAQPAAAWAPDGLRIVVALSYDEPLPTSDSTPARVVLYTTAADGSDRRDLVREVVGGRLVAAGTRDGAVR